MSIVLDLLLLIEIKATITPVVDNLKNDIAKNIFGLDREQFQEEADFRLSVATSFFENVAKRHQAIYSLVVQVLRPRFQQIQRLELHYGSI
jgi:stress-induced morphogen